MGFVYMPAAAESITDYGRRSYVSPGDGDLKKLDHDRGASFTKASESPWP